MFDVLFFLVFGWVLTTLGMDDMILDSLESVFNREFSIVYYYAVFALIGISTRVLSWIQDMMSRD